MQTKLIKFNGKRIRPDLNALEALNMLADHFPGSAIFPTNFTPEDQVVAHLIFNNNLRIRAFSHAGGEHFGILRQTVERYGVSIEVPFYQSDRASGSLPLWHPKYEISRDAYPESGLLGHLLRGKHVIITSLRQDQLKDRSHASPFEWDASRQKFRFHPLFYWTARDIQNYIRTHDIPYLPGTLATVARIVGLPSLRRLFNYSHTSSSRADVLKPVVAYFTPYQISRSVGISERLREILLRKNLRRAN